jgi:hypothetical protein
MSAENSIRIFLSCLGLYAVLFGPSWLIVVPMLLLSMRFRAWEVIALGLLADFLWLPGLHLPLFLIAGICIVWVFEPLRRELLVS